MLLESDKKLGKNGETGEKILPLGNDMEAFGYSVHVLFNSESTAKKLITNFLRSDNTAQDWVAMRVESPRTFHVRASASSLGWQGRGTMARSRLPTATRLSGPVTREAALHQQ